MNRFRAVLFMFSVLFLNAFIAAQAAKSAAPQTAQPSKTSPSVPSSWQKVPIPALHQFKPQEPKRIELANGMVIFLQENHELPLIEGDIRIRGGSREEPADKIGMIAMYADVWRTGGTKAKTGDELDDFLEAHAARVEASDSADSTFLSWSSLKENYDQVFPVVL